MIGIENDPTRNDDQARLLYTLCVVGTSTCLTFAQRYFVELYERRQFVKLWLEEKKNF